MFSILQDHDFSTVLRGMVYLCVSFPLEQLTIKEIESYVKKFSLKTRSGNKNYNDVALLVHMNSLCMFKTCAPVIIIVLLGLAIISSLTNMHTDMSDAMEWLSLLGIVICSVVVLNWTCSTISKCNFLNVFHRLSSFDRAQYGMGKIPPSLRCGVCFFNFVVFMAALHFLHNDIKSYACVVSYVVFAVKLWMRLVLRLQHPTPYARSNAVLSIFSILSVVCMSFPQRTEIFIILAFLDMMLYIPEMWIPNFDSGSYLLDLAYYGQGNDNSRDKNRVGSRRVPYNPLKNRGVAPKAVCTVEEGDELCHYKPSSHGQCANTIVLIFKGSIVDRNNQSTTESWNNKTDCVDELKNKYFITQLYYEVKIKNDGKTIPLDIHTAWLKDYMLIHTLVFIVLFASIKVSKIHLGAHSNSAISLQ